MDDFTVGDLIRHLQSYDPDDKIGIAGGLTFYRLKRRGPKLVMIEVNEFEAFLTPEFREENPEVKVAFCTYEPTGEILQQVDVPCL